MDPTQDSSGNGTMVARMNSDLLDALARVRRLEATIEASLAVLQAINPGDGDAARSAMVNAALRLLARELPA